MVSILDATPIGYKDIFSFILVNNVTHDQEETA